ncbi:hypothetical protein CDD82_5038 [Ophiocordyceps australis]|uniref:NADH:flavin oxidoreductase/NADH oxidase N-terminal domain-containing protein n=1 Tax=Ophiocordyceps australis TaxID=1399860 RepID=A0A2C5YZN0_9HYPO|nr:hypothetical protein CDD82_5038 [Ophiocordyceps australis]
MARFDLRNKGQAGVPFYTPAQEPAAGTATNGEAAPTLFQPLTMRSVELANRIVVSPMCQYSADNGHLTDYHVVHLGQFALRGAGLVIVEASAVEPRGRISPQDVGLWSDSQAVALRRVVDFVHSQGGKIGIQLAHAGRKASTLAPWVGESASKTLAGEEQGGWPDDVVGPSAVAFDQDHAMPRALTLDEVQQLVDMFAQAARRAVKAGVDVIEIHGAHGYLISSFLSPLSNKRTDDYGGSLENRWRFLRQVAQAVRATIPDTMPLWVRISATEWMEWAGEPSWHLDSTVALAKHMASWGVDVIDVSSGGNNSKQRIPRNDPGYQTRLAQSVRRALRHEGLDMAVGAVGLITQSTVARDIVEQGPEQSGDLVLVGRQFLRDGGWVLTVAQELGVAVKWPVQYHRASERHSLGSRDEDE